jgi:hypothetical protein
MRAGYLGLVFIGLLACGGGKRETAKDPTDVKDGTPSNTEDTPKWEGAAPPQESTTTTTPGGAKINEPPKQRADQYDKEETETVLRRAARQVHDNCGATKDENGKAIGPWGKFNVSVQLGRNGHSKGVTVPAPYQGKPVGNCVEKAFTNLTFPPWGGSDTTVDWEVELVQPK